ncbi:MAG: universal stress protein, partial [Alphaproteobacteria bacterium]
LAAGEDDQAAATAAGLERYLAWHGLRTETRVVSGMEEGVGPALLAGATAAGAGMLVMGAYTHNRFRQMIFGGVTRHVLAHAGLPVLIAH